MSLNNFVRLIIWGLILFTSNSGYAVSPISGEDRSNAKFRGEISAIAEWCGLDWSEQSFLPFMNSLRKLGKSDDVVTFSSVYHGIYMANKSDDLEKLGRKCVASDIDGIKPHLFN